MLNSFFSNGTAIEPIRERSLRLFFASRFVIDLDGELFRALHIHSKLLYFGRHHKETASTPLPESALWAFVQNFLQLFTSLSPHL